MVNKTYQRKGKIYKIEENNGKVYTKIKGIWYNSSDKKVNFIKSFLLNRVK